jgi:hypothetical protein
MADENMASGARAVANQSAAYEPPRLTAIGNLRDLLAGTGSLPCDGEVQNPGPDPFPGGGDVCVIG